MKGFRLDRPADRWCLGCGLVLVLSLLLSDTVLRAYVALTDAHPFAAGFCKFALLATFGESLAQRMLVGRYLPPRFGLVPRALAWGALGICITLAFMIFSAGVPLAMSRIGMDWAARALAGPFGTEKLLTAFAISLCLNTLFAPVLMVAHKVSDLHIARYEGDAALLVAPSRRRRAVEVRQLGRHVAAGAVPHRALLLDPRPYHYVSAARSLPGAVRRLARSGTRPDPRVGRFAAGEGLGWRLICLFLIRAPLQRARSKKG